MAELELTYTEVAERKITKTIEVEYPIYRRHFGDLYYDMHICYTKINEDGTAIYIMIRDEGIDSRGDHHNQKYTLTFIDRYLFSTNESLDYSLGRGVYKLSESQFAEAIGRLKTSICGIVDNAND